jgi:hypothetical protein
MRSIWRRYEVLLPLQFNDGRDVPREWLAEASAEVATQFGADSYENQKVEGHWQKGGLVYRESMARLFVDVPDTEASREWMHRFKSRWRARLEQHELWMVSFSVDVE